MGFFFNPFYEIVSDDEPLIPGRIHLSDTTNFYSNDKRRIRPFGISKQGEPKTSNWKIGDAITEMPTILTSGFDKDVTGNIKRDARNHPMFVSLSNNPNSHRDLNFYTYGNRLEQYGGDNGGNLIIQPKNGPIYFSAASLNGTDRNIKEI